MIAGKRKFFFFVVSGQQCLRRFCNVIPDNSKGVDIKAKRKGQGVDIKERHKTATKT